MYEFYTVLLNITVNKDHGETFGLIMSNGQKTSYARTVGYF